MIKYILADESRIKPRTTRQEDVTSSFIEGLISDYQSELLHLAMSYLNDYQLAQDCIQEIFITAFHKVDPEKERTAIRKWLKMCTINRCKSMIRSSFWRRFIFLDND